ncbi:MAG: VWA domain-containing protein [Sphingomonas fennica]
MAWTDVNAKLAVNGYAAAAAATIRAQIKGAYDGSASARALIDAWIAQPGKTITINNVANAANAVINSGVVSFDPTSLTGFSYIDNNGNAVAVQNQHVLVHELVHAIGGLGDNWNNTVDYAGDTVRRTNIILDQLGLPERNAYISVGDASVLTAGFAYTNGAAIDRSQSGNRDWNSSAAGESRDLLIGGASGNRLRSGNGNDFLFGGGGNDTLDGGAGVDTVVLTGKPTDYDIRLNADGTWTSRHVRGAANEGTDTIANLERVQFEGGQTFNLAKSGLTFQTDFSFVVDTTGSMWDDIAAVKSAASGVINALFNNNQTDARINVVTYKDNTYGEPTLVNLRFTDQDSFADRKTAALNAINGISVGGGGDFPETAFDGLLKALDGSAGEWRPGAGTKKVALFTDATAKDAFLLPTVLTYATNIGATISARTTSALGTIGAVDTFELSFAGFDPGSEDDPVVSQPGDPIVVTPPGGKAIVQITTIFITGFTTPDAGLEEASEETGGTVLTASNPAEVVARLLEVITTANYSISTATSSVTEGDSGTTDVVFTVSRDRGDDAAIVSLGRAGTAGAADIAGSLPTSIRFEAGELTRDIVVSVRGDTAVEADETLTLSITGVSTPATILTDSATLTILNDDSAGGTGPIRIVGDANANALTGTGAAELFLGNGGRDRLVGGGGDDIFVFRPEDASGLATIADFGADDLLLSRTRIFDSNSNGIISFGGNRVLDIDADHGVAVFAEDGRRVRQLEYDGLWEDAGGVQYYVYSRVGSAAGVGSLDDALAI